MPKEPDYDYETITTLDNLLPFPEIVKEMERISKKNDIPLDNLCLANSEDGFILVEERFVLGD